MFVQHAIPGIILRECPDRRARHRLTHREPVHVDGRQAFGRDISTKGMAVVMAPSVVVGDVVRVSLSGAPSVAGTVVTEARVARVEMHAGRSIVGLEFVR